MKEQKLLDQCLLWNWEFYFGMDSKGKSKYTIFVCQALRGLLGGKGGGSTPQRFTRFSRITSDADGLFV